VVDTGDRGGWLEAVRSVMASVCASDVTSFELINDRFSIRLVREPVASDPLVTAGVEDAPLVGEHLHLVRAPFTGVFYRSPTPAAKPYVEVGEWVDADAVIGLVETMKIFNEVTADRAGQIVSFQAEAGQLVHAGDPLASIEPAERSVAAPERHL
jgi:acetyl/propionyl-CoA carboxylase alpha subunit